MPEAETQQIPTIIWLLQSGGWAPLAWGFIVALIGIVPIVRPKLNASIFVGILSLTPLIIGLFTVYFAASEFAEMAASTTPPKPAEFAEVTGRAMSCPKQWLSWTQNDPIANIRIKIWPVAG